MANGRRQRCAIRVLREGDNVYSEMGDLLTHIDGFYRELMGSTSGGAASLGPNMWTGPKRVSTIDNQELIRPFSFEEVTNNLKSMRGNTAPGPDGFPVAFYKKFWHLVGPQFVNLVQEFTLGRIDVKHLNYGVLALLPKVQGADNIRQFSPNYSHKCEF